jgi:hypothetical protein
MRKQLRTGRFIYERFSSLSCVAGRVVSSSPAMGREVESLQEIGWWLLTQKDTQLCPGGGVAQWLSHPPEEQKARVRISPGCLAQIFEKIHHVHFKVITSTPGAQTCKN